MLYETTTLGNNVAEEQEENFTTNVDSEHGQKSPQDKLIEFEEQCQSLLNDWNNTAKGRVLFTNSPEDFEINQNGTPFIEIAGINQLNNDLVKDSTDDTAEQPENGHEDESEIVVDSPPSSLGQQSRSITENRSSSKTNIFRKLKALLRGNGSSRESTSSYDSDVPDDEIEIVVDPPSSYHGSTARDIAKHLDSKSEEKAKALILEYANTSSEKDAEQSENGDDDEIEIVVDTPSSSHAQQLPRALKKMLKKERKSNNAILAKGKTRNNEIGFLRSFSPLEPPPDDERRIRYLKLYQAALKGDWNTAKDIYAEYPEDISAKITKEGDTALHVAAAAKHTNFVKEQVNKMNVADLGTKNEAGNTALCLAATSGNVELAMIMLERNRTLALYRGSDEMLPIQLAASSGHREMVRYLYRVTSNQLYDKVNRISYLVDLITTDLYDDALDLAKYYPEVSTDRDRNNETALHVLARKLCANMIHDEKQLRKALDLVELLWKHVVLMMDDLGISELLQNPWKLTFLAAEYGNVEFLNILIREYPGLTSIVNEKGYTIFHIAVLHRHEEIFKVIYELGSLKDLIVSSKVELNRNILHLAGQLPQSERLNIVSGAALQMRQELLWFKEVGKVVKPLDAEAKNEKGETPREVFNNEHVLLKEKGKEWMKNTANSCMVVATLITTVVFAAAFTVPGGNKGDTGIPNFRGDLSFKVFAIADAISLVSSSISILSFLSILTSRYGEEDFISVLPRKLVVGLLTLFVSISAMMVVFSATFFIVFKDGVLWVPILVSGFASFPVIFFIRQQYRLVVDVLYSGSVFKSSKPTIFYNKKKDI